MEVYFTFPSTHTVILAEKVVLAAGIPAKIRPIPSCISAGCGMCLCVPLDLRQPLQNELAKHSVEFSAGYLAQNGQFQLLGK